MAAKSSGSSNRNSATPRPRRRRQTPAETEQAPATPREELDVRDETRPVDFEQLRDEQIDDLPVRSREVVQDDEPRPAREVVAEPQEAEPRESEPRAVEPRSRSGRGTRAESRRVEPEARTVEREPATEPSRPERSTSEQTPAHTPAEADEFGSGLDEPVADRSNRGTDEVTEGRDSEASSSGEGGEGGTDDGQSKRRRKRRRRKRPTGGTGNPPTGTNPPPQRSAPPRPAHNGQGYGQSSQGHGGHGQGYNQKQGYGASRQRNRRDRDRDSGPPGMTGPDHGPVIGTAEGVLEMHPKGYGFLRDPKNNYAAVKTDAFISSTLIEKLKLREGVLVKGEVGQGVKGQGPRLRNVQTIDGRTIDEYQKIKPFDELTAINPFEQIKLETGQMPVTMRVMDLLTPIGKGQRALIVAPPRTGKTMLLQEIANAVSINHPELHLMVLLIDERPEEVTEMRRRVRGEVIASSMDREVESHVRIAQLIVERGKRMAEAGQEVFILLDSITRTARAFNKWISSSGRTASGGLDIRALDIPKKLFGTARLFDEGGSLTIVATALIDTGNRMDEAIFLEFKGTGNMELVLNRNLADRRVWPSIDMRQSGTRREEKILSPEVLEGVTLLRRSLATMDVVEAMEQLIKTLGRFPSNKEFLARIRSIM